ncbi:MAG TPA: hypothetical protein VGJ84_07895 [Polyangiaceae bacterium]
MLALARSCQNCAEFIVRYHEEIIGRLIPLQDLQHEDSGASVSWNSVTSETTTRHARQPALLDRLGRSRGTYRWHGSS